MPVPNEVVLAYPECPKCGNKNQWVESEYEFYGKTLEKANILNVYEWDEEKEEEVEVPEKWECAKCGHVWVDRDVEERVEKVRKRKKEELICRKIKRTFREQLDMRLRKSKRMWEDIEEISSLSELKRYFVESFGSGEDGFRMLAKKAGVP
ncbi:hypothetical protein AKJ41_04490 [candidate division MSBL1 archaeon SCGC-AAA259O05]|uniref:Uncharacterized protein n=1 Tax=candidate division MSBL1 archaeon SCGC-AAA259O05 TaxID=1698271 RepID=A0A133V0R7_9EURY|nr:hypothetical protein AKJ41_04490 [candidate division MSBL1 archaeon SCGC-AAA259O05]